MVLFGFNDLLTLNPVLADQWDYEKNTLKPSEVTLSSDKRAWWICEKGHSWQTSIHHRQRGSGCPYCSGREAITGENDLATVRPDIAAEWDCEKNGVLKAERLLPQSNKKVWWKCKCEYSWRTPVYRRYAGSGCPACAGDVVIKGRNDLQSQHPHVAEQWDFTKNHQNPDEVFAHSNKYAWWLCKKGHSWEALINNRTGKGRGCPYCAGFLPISGETDLLSCGHSFSEQWDYEKNIVDIRTVSESSHKRVWWRCAEGHSWMAAVKTRFKGNGCPYCAGKKAILGETDLLTLAPHLAKEWDYERNTVDMSAFTLKSNVKVWWVCEHGHRWKTQIYVRSALGCGCPYCDGKVVYSSKNVKG